MKTPVGFIYRASALILVFFGSLSASAASELTVALSDDGLPIIRYQNAPVIRARYFQFNAEYQGGNPRCTISPVRDNVLSIVGGPSRPQGIQWKGELTVSPGKDIVYQFTIKDRKSVV